VIFLFQPLAPMKLMDTLLKYLIFLLSFIASIDFYLGFLVSEEAKHFTF
jgi:hypothetical protein